MPGSAIEFEVEIGEETIRKNYASNLRKFASDAEISGFRKGRAPEKLVEEKYGQMKILESIAGEIAQDATASIIQERKLNFVTAPKILITSIALGSPMKFKTTLEILPEVKLPNYKTIAKKINSNIEPIPETNAEEIENSIMSIRKIFAKQSGKENELPEVNDDFVKQLGDFSNVEDFKTKLKNSILEDKIRRAKEKKRLEIAENIVNEMKIEIPESLVIKETERLEKSFEAEIGRLGIKIGDYLSKIKKTVEDLRSDWKVEAVKQIKIILMISKIALEENLSASKEEIGKEAAHLKKHYASETDETLKSFVNQRLVNQKVFEYLEGIR
jgi:trigger factor